MAKVVCRDCGFLATWSVSEGRFLEATRYFRKVGQMEGEPGKQAMHCQCFIQKEDLLRAIYNQSNNVENEKTLQSAQRQIMETERDCDGFVPWIQGFHPKEHQEMMYQEELRKAERSHANRSLAVAVFAALITAASGFVGAYIALQGARMGADATRESAKWQVEALREQTEAQMKMTQMQIEAQKEIAKTSPPMKVIVRMPPVHK